MKDGFVRVAASTPAIRVADCRYNAESVIEQMKEAEEKKVKILVLPELCLTASTAGDLFLHDTLLQGALDALLAVRKASEALDLLTFVGMPIACWGRLYNCAVAVKGGRILGATAKRFVAENEHRYFSPGGQEVHSISLLGEQIPFGSKLIYSCEELPSLRVAVELGKDLWAPCPPSVENSMAGANLVIHLSAVEEEIGRREFVRNMISSHSARLLVGYVSANAGVGESTQDMVHGGQNIICENGMLLAESKPFQTGLIISEIDLQYLEAERRKASGFEMPAEDYTRVPFSLEQETSPLMRPLNPMPFVPVDVNERTRRCEEILSIQSQGLMQRLRHIHGRCAVIGVSGGLDSTLALLVAARAFRALNLDMHGVKAITMPCFGTTKRTRSNAQILTECLGMDFIEVPIAETVRAHFRDIGQDENQHDVTYENAQARERTQVLMDIANKHGGIVIGTGDLSELALGWATYNGDHMSMYGVNASVPKTLIRYLVRHEAEIAQGEALKNVLRDILDTPVSPELLPPVDGDISQKTEDLVGPYELHDFFLYYLLRRHCPPRKIFRLAQQAFEGRYDDKTIRSWLKVFCRRFFNQQFKRSCLPDGPKVGSVSVSPRGGLNMPSDANSMLWQEQL